MGNIKSVKRLMTFGVILMLFSALLNPALIADETPAVPILTTL